MAENPFEAAKTILLESGWVQETMSDGTGRMCMGAALFRATRGHDTAWVRVWEKRHPVTSIDRYVTTWNDKFGRTFDEVMDELDACSRVWKEHHG